MPDVLSATRLGADHEARYNAAEMIWLWGGELYAHRKYGGRELLSNFDPGGATGTRTAHQVITHHGRPSASGRNPGAASPRIARCIRIGWPRSGVLAKAGALVQRTVTTHCFHAQG